LVKPSILHPGEEHTTADFHVPLSREAISLIEDRRTGDVEYAISAYLMVAPVVGEETPVLGIPHGAVVVGRFGNSFGREKIPRSQWLELLQSMGWDETLLIELPYRLSGRAHPVATSRWEEAMQHYRQGDWEETLAACRKVFEMLAYEKTAEGSAQPDMRRLREWFEPSDKGNHLNEMLTAFGKFLHLARHQQSPTSGIRIGKDDAMLALTTTAALLRYLN
jgi:hypothetical protein